VDRQLARDLLLQVGYVGSQSYHTNLTMDTNTAPPEVCQNQQGCRSGGVLPAAQSAIVPQGTTYMPSRPPVVVNGVTLTQRPNPYVSNTVTWFGQGTASYHALNVSLLKRASRGLTFKANYSYAKVMISKEVALECKRRIRKFRRLQKQIDALLAEALRSAPWLPKG